MKKALFLLLFFCCVFAFYSHAQNTDSVKTETQTFNVNDATQHYLNTLSGKAREKSDTYFEGGYWLILWNTLYSILIAAIFLFTGLSRWMKNLAARFKNVNIQNFIYGVLYFVIAWLLLFPLNVYESYFREHHYALSNLSFAEWFKEDMIGLSISCIGGSLLFVLVYAAMRKTGKSWWVWGTVISIVFMFFVQFIAPVFITPLFNDYKPLADGPLKQEILSMARANQIPADNVYQFDASKQSDRISANVSGIANTTRISLNDNLLKRCTPAEIKSVMGHEMGHYVMHHIYKGMVEMGVILLIMFALVNFVFNKIIGRNGTQLGIGQIWDIGSLPLLIAIFTVVSFLFTPVINTMIRTQEAEADMFGLDVAREPDAEAHVDMMLSEYRKIDPGHWEEIIFYDHPGGRNRVRMAMQWKAEHLKDCK